MSTAESSSRTAAFERDFIAGLLDTPDRIGEAGELLPEHFADHRLGIVFATVRTMAESGVDILSLVHELDAAGDLARMGDIDEARRFIADLHDDGGIFWNPKTYADEIRVCALQREELGIISTALERGAAEPGELERIKAIKNAIGQIRLGGGLDVADFAFSGDRTRDLIDRPELESPMPDLLDPYPCLVVSTGKPKTGKTTHALAVAQRWALGLPLWPGHKPLPGTRSAVISAEQPAQRVTSTLRRLDVVGTGEISRDAWIERMPIIARDRDLPAQAQPLFVLDQAGRDLLSQLLFAAAKDGDPFGFIVLDSLSRLKPAEIEENDNDGISAWLGSLQVLAELHSVYIVLIHHVGHMGRSEARSAARGASSIAAVAQVSWLLERDDAEPQVRILKADGNAIMPNQRRLEVAPESEQDGAILYFRPAREEECHPADYLMPGETLNTTELAWRLAGETAVKGKEPSRTHTRRASYLRDSWIKQRLVELIEGPGKSKTFRLSGIESGRAGGNAHPA